MLLLGSGGRRAGAAPSGDIGLVGDVALLQECSGARRAGAAPSGGISFGWRWVLLCNAAMALVALVLLLAETSARSAIGCCCCAVVLVVLVLLPTEASA